MGDDFIATISHGVSKLGAHDMGFIKTMLVSGDCIVENMNTIRHGSCVTLHFTLLLAEGRVVDTSRASEPLTLIVGQGDIAPGLERYLVGLCAGDQRRINIPGDEVYGPRDPDAVQTIAHAEFPPELTPEPGQVLGFTTPTGEEIPALVMAIKDDGVQIDFSHPLAGHDLIFEVEILTVLPGNPHVPPLIS